MKIDQGTVAWRLENWSTEQWHEFIHELIARHGTPRSFRKRETIFLQGMPSLEVYAILDGRIETTSVNLAGRQIAHSIHGPGEIFGIAELIMNMPRVFNAFALEDVETILVGRAQFNQLLAADPSVAIGLLNKVINKIIVQSELLVNFGHTSAKPRVATVLLQQVATMSTGRVGDSPHSLHLTHEEIARLCGIARQTVTRVLNEMQDEGAVALHFKSVDIIDLDVVREMTEV